MKITKKMKLGNVINKHPKTMDVFLKYGLHCIGCQMSAFETIEQGATAHGIPVDKLVKDLNKIVEKKIAGKKKVKKVKK